MTLMKSPSIVSIRVSPVGASSVQRVRDDRPRSVDARMECGVPRRLQIRVVLPRGPEHRARLPDDLAQRGRPLASADFVIHAVPQLKSVSIH